MRLGRAHRDLSDADRRTATVAETVRKAAHRIVGTMIGLVGAIALVPVLGPDVAVVLPVILLSIFGALYLFRLSYALMIFFITLMLGELYALLGTFTVDLMVLRLEETVVGGPQLRTELV